MLKNIEFASCLTIQLFLRFGLEDWPVLFERWVTLSLYRVDSVMQPLNNRGLVLIPVLVAWRNLEYFYSLVHHRVTPRIKCAGAHLNTWMDGSTVLHKNMTQCPQLGLLPGSLDSKMSTCRNTNHEANTPSKTNMYMWVIARCID